jgi:hypothetical protein
VTGAVLLPQQATRDALALQLGVHVDEVWHRERRRRGLRRIQACFQGGVVQIGGPPDSGLSRPAQALLHRTPRHDQAGGDLPLGQTRLKLEAKNLSNLAHGQPRLRHLDPLSRREKGRA